MLKALADKEQRALKYLEPATSGGPSAWVFTVIIVVVLLGFSSSVYLAKAHYSILSGKSSGPSFCSVSEVVDCDAVAASPYSEIYEIPWASFGALVYLVMLSFSILGVLYVPLSRFSLRFVALISGLCLLFDAYLAFIGFVVLKLICLVCLFTYLINLAIFILSKTALKESVGSIIKEAWKSLPFLDTSLGVQKPMARLFHCMNLVMLLFGFAIVIGIRWHFVGDKQEAVRKILGSLDKQNPVALSLEGAPRLGPEKARLILVEFSDFQCPYCKEFASALKMVQKRYPKEVALYFKHYPLDNACNPYMQKPFHPEACNLAQLSICIQERGLFWDMEEMLFNSKGPLDSLSKAFTDKGLNPEEILSCSLQPEAREKVLKDIHEGRKAGVRATPTIFINGYKLEGAIDSFTLSLLVDHLLSMGRVGEVTRGGS